MTKTKTMYFRSGVRGLCVVYDIDRDVNNASATVNLGSSINNPPHIAKVPILFISSNKVPTRGFTIVQRKGDQFSRKMGRQLAKQRHEALSLEGATEEWCSFRTTVTGSVALANDRVIVCTALLGHKGTPEAVKQVIHDHLRLSPVSYMSRKRFGETGLV